MPGAGCYLGLRPLRSQSGARDPQLGNTKAGNPYLRSLLVDFANHVLGQRGENLGLRQCGLQLASRAGKSARNRAIVAVARKLAVLFHRIWITQKPYVPFTLLPESRRRCLLVATTRVPMTACRVWLLRRSDNWQRRLLLLNPNRHRARTPHLKCE
jgi:hypothetical protein